jgi:hypothetical protein
MMPTYQKISPSTTPNEQLHINTFNFSYLLTKLDHLMHLTESTVAVAAPQSKEALERVRHSNQAILSVVIGIHFLLIVLNDQLIKPVEIRCNISTKIEWNPFPLSLTRTLIGRYFWHSAQNCCKYWDGRGTCRADLKIGVFFQSY